MPVFLKQFRMNEIVLESLSSFMVLFAVIDIIGSIPVILAYKEDGMNIHPLKITLVSFFILLLFLFAGKLILGLFGVDISSFAIAGSIVIFVLASEMIFGITVFKNDAQTTGASIVPIAFPLIAGAGSITTLISLRAEYSLVSIIVSLSLNMVVVYFVLKLTHRIGKILGPSGIHIIRKVFGIILLSIAIKLFLTNTGIEL